MRLAAITIACVLPITAFGQSFQVHGFLTGRLIDVKAQPSWATGGIGRFDVGASDPSTRHRVNVDVAQLGMDWTPTTWLLLHADGIARKEPSGTGGRRGGLLQAFVDLHTPGEKLRLRAGSFWLGTSRENVDPLWTSPYTINQSALNTWIGEEVRPVGIDLQYAPNFYFSLGGTAFRGLDTMGTELAARGWALGNRLSVYDEKLPLPDHTTVRAIGPDLDNRNGYSERIRVQLPERALLQVTHVDNRARIGADLKGQTPWHTRFNLVGTTIGPSAPTTLSAEWVRGTTTVGFRGGSASIDFDTVYVLLSQKTGSSRWSLRAEQFSTKSGEYYTADANREHGHAFTVSWLFTSNPHVRWGVEWEHATGARPGAAAAGLNPNSGGTAITAELRWAF